MMMRNLTLTSALIIALMTQVSLAQSSFDLKGLDAPGIPKAPRAFLPQAAPLTAEEMQQPKPYLPPVLSKETAGTGGNLWVDAPIKPAFTEPEAAPDIESANASGFRLLVTRDWPDDPRSEMVRKHFTEPLAAEDGASNDQIGLTDWALADLTGSGRSDLVLFPRIVGDKKTWSDSSEGPRVIIYHFEDGQWRKVLESYAMEVGYRTSEMGYNIRRYEVALMQVAGFDRFVWDGHKFVATH